MKPIIICADCGRKRQHCAHGLCASCYYQQNREVILAKNKVHYQQNRKRILARDKARYKQRCLENPGEMRASRRAESHSMGKTCRDCGESITNNAIRCQTCSRRVCRTSWKGGRIRDRDGYISIWEPSHPNAKKHGYVLEHRLIMSESLGRPLHPWEVVHHKNGTKDDNRIENLELFPKQTDHLGRELAKAEVLKWQRAFYRAVGLWLGERRREIP